MNMFLEIESDNEFFCASILIYSVLVMMIVLWFDKKYDIERLEKLVRREKVLKNTKNEAIKESMEILHLQKRINDIETGAL